MQHEFKKGNQLINELGESICDQMKLREALKLQGKTSLYNAVIPMLLLYRFPALFDLNQNSSVFSLILFQLKSLSAYLVSILDDIKFIIYSIILKLRSHKEIDLSRKDGLFLFAHNNFYRDVLEPVQKDMKSSSAHNLGVIKITNDHYEKSHNTCYLNFFDSKAKKRKKTLDKELYSLRKKIFSPHFCKLIVNLELKFGLKKNFLLNELKWLFYRELPRLTLHLAIAERIFSYKNINILVTADDADQKTRVYNGVAKSNNIKCLVVQQGMTRCDYPDWKYSFADSIACMGDASKENIVKQGIDENIITVTGHPGFDRSFHTDFQGILDLKKKYVIDDSKHNILFASQPFLPGAFLSPERRYSSFSLLYDYFSSKNDTNLLIKPHPSDSIRELKSIFKESENIIIFSVEEDIINCIELCSLFLTHFSQTTLQALMTGKPVINVDLANCFNRENFGEMLGVESIDNSLINIANNTDQLNSLIEDLINEDHSAKNIRIHLIEKFLYRNIFKMDGLASKRISLLINEIL